MSRSISLHYLDYKPSQQETEAVILLMSKPSDFIDKKTNFSSQNTQHRSCWSTSWPSETNMLKHRSHKHRNWTRQQLTRYSHILWGEMIVCPWSLVGTSWLLPAVFMHWLWRNTSYNLNYPFNTYPTCIPAFITILMDKYYTCTHSQCDRYSCTVIYCFQMGY